MRHLKAGKRLGVTTSHRKAMMRNLVTALLEHGEIKTTITRAKEMRKYFDKMIGLGKRADLHSRRQATAFIKSKEAVQRLFEEYGPLYENRNGGYTRIYRLGRRLGDNAQMVLIQMVDLKAEEPKPAKKSAPEAISEIKSELQAEEAASSAAEKTPVEAEATEAVEEAEATEAVEEAEATKAAEAGEAADEDEAAEGEAEEPAKEEDPKSE